jgi:cytidine deaminase
MQKLHYSELSASDRRLVDAAQRARERAHAKHSQFQVGAAARYGNTVVLGCNVESDVYGLTNCAERTAVFAAHANGAAKHSFTALAVIADTPAPVAPCGACRQVLIEKGGPALRVIMANTRGDIAIATAADLLPGWFRLERDETTQKSTPRKKTTHKTTKR